MQLIHERCAGLDVHKQTIVACVMLSLGPKVTKQTRTFGTTMSEIVALADWLKSHEVTHVAMESTGPYWIPVYNLLEEQFEVLVVNAAHIKAVPGRKTDVKDAEWIADLLRHGLVRGSFVPPKPQRQLRVLTRHRINQTQRRAQLVNEVHKLTEQTNLKLNCVATDVMGVSGRAMLEALLGGESDPAVLAELAKGKLRKKLPQLREALAGKLEAEHRLVLGQLLADIELLEEQIAESDAAIAKALEPYARELELLDGLPGVDRRVAEVFLAEAGADMSRFPSAQHLASWVGLCPGNNQSGGKRLSGRTRKGNKYLRSTYVEAAHGAARKKASYTKAQYHRLAGRRGKKRALVAVAHGLMEASYIVLSRKVPYRDLGGNYFDTLNPERLKQRLVLRLQGLGYQVSLTPALTVPILAEATRARQLQPA